MNRSRNRTVMMVAECVVRATETHCDPRCTWLVASYCACYLRRVLMGIAIAPDLLTSEPGKNGERCIRNDYCLAYEDAAKKYTKEGNQ